MTETAHDGLMRHLNAGLAIINGQKPAQPVSRAAMTPFRREKLRDMAYHQNRVGSPIVHELLDGIDRLSDDIAAAQAVIDKLPVYADTGKPFVRGVDVEWIIDGALVKQLSRWITDYGPTYSTSAAALAAQEASKP